MLHHVGIYVSDMKRSSEFYELILPVTAKEKLTWNDTELLFLKGEGFQIELIHAAFDHAATHIAFSVTSVTEKINELKQAGVTPIEGPYELPNGWSTVFYEGPDDEEIEFICTTKPSIR
ncbi:VOC family protein [Fictibacillus sp. b24]|uniref:VOC family protein n=1 Tax=Fictibacillus sp. b24 TaxID=3055863 RepID=UPI0025A05B76|nr:VOC family protein [Fictibacillus sp. b24]MDM5318303.1 VOC family protein [Fictibacillus sp. b24]